MALPSVLRAYAEAKIDPSPLAFSVAADDDRLTLDLLDVIGEDWFGEGITARAIALELAASDAPEVRVRLNSPGGDATEGTAIRSMLRTHAEETGAKIVVEIHGLAASAASIIALAGDEIRIAPDALFMIHEAWVVTGGNASDLERTAGVLGKMNSAMAAAYSARSGKPVAEVRELMAAETWFTAKETIAAGFADSMLEASDADETINARAATERSFTVLSAFAGQPADRYRTKPGELLVAAMATTEKVDHMKREILIKALALGADADDAAILAAIATLGEAKALAAEYRAEVAALKTERDDEKHARAVADVQHRIKQLETSGRATPGEAKALAAKFEARSKRGALAVELFLEDLGELESGEPNPLVAESELAGRAAPAVSGPGPISEVTPELRAEHPGVSDKQILETENVFRAKARAEAEG